MQRGFEKELKLKLEQTIIKAAVRWHKAWRYSPRNDEDGILLRAVNNYLGHKGIQEVDKYNYCNHDVMVKLNEVIRWIKNHK
jgi:hypothetical protein